ncbi:flagellar hook-basal body complex protein FliE [Litorimonas taeanensis]|uniref:Flagellar hook-basal body complex protein FliE n=1 Tax=Litorimonas taeanensis TaxID=568099 RepID=A0A420WM68_9PROT|nr:flagellar hook-basal body complex protein FliE [Litorimonas taeanensis]RKQ72141.1 flagellar hook-basal body complex protein FliE [Litorimonas taeanensis]
MQPSSIGAMRHYQMAKQALSNETGGASPDVSKVGGGENALVEGVKDFAQVFENVETQTQMMASGQADAHSVVEAMANAEVALETAVTIRNRVVEAYQELLRMPI